MAARHLNITALLHAIDHNDLDWLSRQSADAQKEFAAVVALRWAASVSDGPEAEYMLWVVNERVNGSLFDFAQQHPDLIYRLLASCGLGVSLRHHWVPGPARKVVRNAASKLLYEHYPEASDAEVALLLTRYDRDEFIQFIDECGVQPKDAKDMIKVYDQISQGDETKR